MFRLRSLVVGVAGLTRAFFFGGMSTFGNSPRTILEELRAIQSTDVVLPIAADPVRELRIRCVVRPDDAACHLLDRMGLRLPEPVRPAISATPM